MIYNCKKCGQALMTRESKCPVCNNYNVPRITYDSTFDLPPNPNSWQEKAMYHEMQYWEDHGLKGYDGFKKRVKQLNLEWGRKLITKWGLTNEGN